MNSTRRHQSGIALVTVLVFLMVIAAMVVLRSGEHLGEIQLAAADAEVRRIDYVAQAGLQHALWRAQDNACTGDFTIPATNIGPDSYSATTTGGGSNTLYTLSADQDAWIRSDNPTNTGGGNQHIRSEGAIFERALYRFNLSALPPSSQVKSAVGWFYLESGKEHPQGPLTVNRVTADWTEGDATWEALNDEFDTAALGMIPAQPIGGVWVSVNLTAQVQAWMNGQPNFGIALSSSAEGIHAEYKSREDGSTPPRLEVVVGSGAASPLNIQAAGTLSTGVTKSLARPTALAYQPPGSVALQLSVDPGEDAMADSFYSTRNYGGATYVQINDNGSDWQQYPLIRFDLAKVPRGASVRSAQLELHMRNLNTPGSATIHQVTRSWMEGTKSGGGQADGATWFTFDGTSNWASAGGDFNPAVVAETVIDGSEDWVSWDIAPLVERWLAGDPNYGLMIRPANGIRQAEFESKEDPNIGVAPKLTITYSCECGSACMAPQGTGKILLVVDSKTSPVPGDQALQALLESWGYTVTLIADEAGQNGYNTEFGQNDVVFISESVNAGTLGAKVSAAPIGVVSAEGLMNPQLGIATGRGTPVGDTIEVVDNSHYITAVFPAAPLQFKTAATELASVSGTVSPEALVLAEVGNVGSLVALESGAAAAGGGSVLSRRVLVPAGDANATWNYLTNNGQLIIQRAIAWAMGEDAISIGNVMLVVVNPSNLTAGETAKQALIQSFGFTVNLIDESASQAEFDAAFADNDAAYIPQEITSSNLGTKLRNASIGVVNEEGEQVDELGFANDKLFKNRQEIDVIDNTHYITETFATGLLTFVSSNQSVHLLDGGAAPDLQVLGETFNVGSQWKKSLSTLDPGDTLSDGGSAAGRRVHLPWGGGTFDINLLTDDGRTIMRRALEWGTGAATSTAPIAHWPLNEGSGPTVADIVGGNDATRNGATWTTGTLGGALDFDGSGDTAATDSNFTPPPVGTVMFWMQVSGSPTSQGRILGLADNWEVRHVTAGEPDGIASGLVFDLGVSGANTEFATTTTVDVPGRWYHIAASYDTTTDAYAIYIDGMPHRSGTYPSSLSLPADDVLSFGTRTGSSQYFDGTLDDIRVYDRFLSASEIADIAAEGGSNGPVAHWKLDDGAGATATDSEGNNDGTLVNGPVWVAGALGDALHFDGTNDRVDVGSFDVTGSGLTLMGWFNADALPAAVDPRLISKASSTAEADAWWQLSILTSTSNANIRFRAKAGGTTSTLIDSSTNLNAGEWYFAAGTYNAANGEMKLYLNGIEVASQTHPVGGAIDTNAAIPVALGANGSPEQFFDGVLDDMRVYDKALSASEIAALYAQGGGGGGPSTTFEVRVASSSDDGEEVVSNGAMNLTSSDLELISDGSTVQLVGMRFANVTVPRGATISNAYVQFQVDETDTGDTKVFVWGQAIDTAPTFTNTSFDISSRSRTAASIGWTPVAWNTVDDAGPDQQTPNIASVIKEIVDRPGWASGNDIVIIITGSGERTAESYDGVSSAAPLLHVEYSE